jgi:D-glycero-D-manno-heptose 1,7-bisphosphate phosphatase
LFIDRDGTLNIEKGYLKHFSEVELYQDCIALIKKANELRMNVIVISNQPVIARGEASFEDVTRIHAEIDFLLSKEDAYVDEYYFCPHHPDSGFNGEVSSLKIDCNCRKPKLGLFEKACAEFKIDLSRSVMVGDTWRDVFAGKAFGLKTVHINRSTEVNFKVGEPDLSLNDLRNLIPAIESMMEA